MSSTLRAGECLSPLFDGLCMYVCMHVCMYVDMCMCIYNVYIYGYTLWLVVPPETTNRINHVWGIPSCS